MKYDVVIIGGGLAGLTAGISLQKNGKKCCIISEGQSSLAISAGTMNLLNCTEDGKAVENPVEAIATLSENHPYRKLENVAALAQEAKELLNSAGLEMSGEADRNQTRLTASGTCRPCWLVPSTQMFNAAWKSVTIVDLLGFNDFNSTFVADGLKAKGIETKIVKVSLDCLAALRKNPTEMRSINISRVFMDSKNIDALISAIGKVETDAIVLPSVFSMKNLNGIKYLQKNAPKPVCLIPTVPPSIEGLRIGFMLQDCFTSLGGVIISGDSVKASRVAGGKVVSVETEKLQGTDIEADNFVLATGGFFSKGLMADSDNVFERALNADVDFEGNAATWAVMGAFNPQPYMNFGVKTDQKLNVIKGGQTLTNTYAAGSVLSNSSALQLGCKDGVAMLTALQVSKEILKTK